MKAFNLHKYHRAKADTPEWRLYCLGRVAEDLVSARNWASPRAAGAPMLKAKIDRAISSLKGAIRHADRVRFCAREGRPMQRRRKAARAVTP